MKSKEILYVINSIINKPGNIGYRIGKIIELNEIDDSKVIIFSRKGQAAGALKNKSMGVFGDLPRLLNAFRIYVYPRFKHRIYDKLLFEFFFTFNWFGIRRRFKAKKIAHVVEYSPYIINKLKLDGYHVLLDVPIGPSRYMKRLVDEHGEDLSDIGAIYMQEYEEASFKAADSIVVPSLFVKNEIVACGIPELKVNVIPFGVDINQGAKKTSFKTKSSLDYVFAGMLCRRKGLEYLLEAWSNPSFSNDRLHLCGRITPEIKKLIRQNKLNNVILPGFVDTTEYFSKCDVYVFPSLLEGSSKSIYEAMNCSLPIITTLESGSIIEDDVHGFIVPKCDSDALKHRMILMKDNKLRERLSLAAHDYVQGFTWEMYSNNIHALYNDIYESIND